MASADEPRYSQAQVDEIIGNRLREQSERSWSERVNGGLLSLSEQQSRLADSFKDLADTNRDVHAVLTGLLSWQAEQMQAAKDFRADAMTPEMRRVFFDMAKTFLWIKGGWKMVVAVWGLVVVLVAPVVSHLVDVAFHLSGK